MNMDNLINIFNALNGNDNNSRREAEKMYENFKQSDPNTLCQLLAECLNHENAVIRSQSSVYLRSLFDYREKSNVWEMISDQIKEHMKDHLLQSLINESYSHIRRQKCHNMAQVAERMGTNGWPELLPATASLISGDADGINLSRDIQVEIGLILLQLLSEYMPEGLIQNVDTLIPIYQSGLNYSTNDNKILLQIRLSTFTAYCSLIIHISDQNDLFKLQNLLNEMLEMPVLFLNEGEEYHAQETLKFLIELAENNFQFLLSSLEELTKLMLTIVETESLEIDTRQLALEFIIIFTEKAGVIISKQDSLIEHVVSLILSLMCDIEESDTWHLRFGNLISGSNTSMNSDENNNQNNNNNQQQQQQHSHDTSDHSAYENEDEDDEGEIAHTAAIALDRFTNSIGGTKIIPILLPIVSNYLNTNEWKKQRAGIFALTIIAGTSKKLMWKQFPEIIPLIAQYANADHMRVRYTVLHCFGQLADDFKIVDNERNNFQSLYSQYVLPAILGNLGEINQNLPRLHAFAATALINFVNPTYITFDLIQEYFDNFITILVNLLQNPTGNAIEVQEQVITAIGTLARVSGENFANYYNDLMPAFISLLQQDPNTFNINNTNNPLWHIGLLRGKTMESIALMGTAVGKEIFEKDAHNIIQLLLNNDNAFIPGNIEAQYVLNASARIAAVLKGDFVQYLPRIIPNLLNIASQQPDISKKIVDPETARKIGNDGLDEMQGLSQYQMQIKGVGTAFIGINSAQMLEKTIALQCIFHFAKVLNIYLFEYLLDIYTVILPLLEYRFDESIRIIASAILLRLCVIALRGVMTYKDNLSQNDLNIPQNMINSCIEAYLKAIPLEQPNLGMEPLCIQMDSLSSVLKVIYDSHQKDAWIEVNINNNLIEPIFEIYQRQAMSSLERSYMREEKINNLQNELGELSDVLEEEMEEDRTWENDLMTSVMDGIGWIIKLKKDNIFNLFEKYFENIVQNLLNVESNSSEYVAFGLCMYIDIMEYCEQNGKKYINDIAPLMINFLSGQYGWELLQCSAYGLGILSEKGEQYFTNYIPETIQTLLTTFDGLKNNYEQEYNDNDGDYDEISWETGVCYDGVIASLIKFLLYRRDEWSNINRLPNPNDLFNQLVFELLPFHHDIMEARDINKRIIELIENKSPLINTSIENILLLLGKLMWYEELDEQTISIAMIEGIDIDALWEKQIVTRDTRIKIENLLQQYQNNVSPDIFGKAFSNLDPQGLSWLNVSTEQLDSMAEMINTL